MNDVSNILFSIDFFWLLKNAEWVTGTFIHIRKLVIFFEEWFIHIIVFEIHCVKTGKLHALKKLVSIVFIFLSVSSLATFYSIPRRWNRRPTMEQTFF